MALADIVSFQLRIERTRWEEWKKTLPRDKPLNEAIIELIDKAIEKAERKAKKENTKEVKG
jgi:hypothetical protein